MRGARAVSFRQAGAGGDLSRLVPSPLGQDFYCRDTPLVARDLLGKILLKQEGGRWTGGFIVETEAYLGEADPASHAAGKMTPRNSVMFGPPGQSYVYFIYGMHFCFNSVAFQPGVQRAGAVLVRALEPALGLELMRERRGREKPEELASGPGMLTVALGISRADNGLPLWKPPLMVAEGAKDGSFQASNGVRIGIREGAGLPLRFYVPGSPFVSRQGRQNNGLVLPGE
jgi:DNA-3-methyladenine glycosylase